MCVDAIDPYGQLLAPISSTPAVSEYKYAGKEWDALSTSYDFGARRYMPSIPRWTTMDPLAERYYSISPYVYCAGNPVNLVDKWGRSVYRFDHVTGTVHLFEENDDEYDEIRKFKYNRKTGEYTPSGLIIGRIEKGILQDGMNFNTDNYIEITDKNSPSIDGIQEFLLDFSNMIDKEVGGYYVSVLGEQGIKYVTIGNISRNTATNANPGNPYNALKKHPGFFTGLFRNYHNLSYSFKPFLKGR